MLALFFAFLLNVGGSSGKAGVKGIRGNGFYKLAFFLPQVLSVPVIAVIWSVIMDPTSSGLANSVLGWAGLGPSGWLADPNLALGACCGYWSGAVSGSTWCCSTRRCRRSPATSSRLPCSTEQAGSRRSSG
ncbi:MAG: hypothetical protein WKF83_05670 [Nocardioidaceae bacterium]